VTGHGQWYSRLDGGPPGTLRLFCFPHAGANSYVFRPWARHLPPSVEIWGVHLPGRAPRLRERPCTRMTSLVPTLAAHLPCTLPFAFYGHSNGALVAFEVARWLHRAGAAVPRHLFLSGQAAPQRPPRHAPLHQLVDEEMVHALRRFQGMPQDVLDSAELMQLLLPVIRADFELSETYVHERSEPLPCGVTCFGGREDDEATHEDLLQWREHTRGGFRVHSFEGGHFFLFQSDRFLPLLCEELSAVCPPDF